MRDGGGGEELVSCLEEEEEEDDRFPIFSFFFSLKSCQPTWLLQMRQSFFVRKKRDFLGEGGQDNVLHGIFCFCYLQQWSNKNFFFSLLFFASFPPLPLRRLPPTS